MFAKDCICLWSDRRIIFRVNSFYRQCTSFAEKPDPSKITNDYVGPPDTESNIRQYVRHIPKNETALAKRLRLKQIEAEAWNHTFWREHNKSFYTERQQFIKKNNLIETDDLYQDKLSVFYKEFLDENLKRHKQYNWAWYKKNFELLLLSFRVNIEKLLNNSRNNSNKT